MLASSGCDHVLGRRHVVADQPKRMHRSRSEKKLLGVLGGVADYTGLDPSLIRIVYVIATILTGFVPGIFLYVVMAFVVPREPKGGSA
ncbi:MAG: PspC domain-containing protein [Chloroflexi bacterium]|nr:PspC domain-containing protein [Chloroflexota bacterium]